MKTISDEYIELNKQLHEAPKGFGGDGHLHVENVLEFSRTNQLYTILDYGCGQGKLKKGLNEARPLLSVVNYDPAIFRLSKKPTCSFALVVCTDVLEHVEPEYLPAVVEDIFNLTYQYAYLIINYCPSNKNLPDGRNAHLSVHSKEWWLTLLMGFDWFLTKYESIPGKGQKIKKGLFILRKN